MILRLVENLGKIALCYFETIAINTALFFHSKKAAPFSSISTMCKLTLSMIVMCSQQEVRARAPDKVRKINFS